jgi:hypothetical protein
VRAAVYCFTAAVSAVIALPLRPAAALGLRSSWAAAWPSFRVYS